MLWADDAIKYGWIGLQTTLLLSASSLISCLVFGLVIGIAGYIFPVSRGVIFLYSQFWRGLPVLVTLFVVFFLLPLINITVSSDLAVVVGLTLWGSANVGEIVYGALRAMPLSQIQAARALGFSKVSLLIHILFPQAIRRMLPSLVNVLSNLVQATSLASAVGAVDFLEAMKRATSNLTFNVGDPHSFTIFGTVMIIYFFICYPLSLISRRMDRIFREN